MKLLHCCDVGCHCCKEAVRVGKTLLGEFLYSCKHAPKKHKSIDGWNCDAFKCDRRGEFPITCSRCRE